MTGKELRETRKGLKLSVDELAAKAKVSTGCIENFEAGKSRPRFSTMKLICKALGIEPEEAELPKESVTNCNQPETEAPDGIAETLAAIQKYGESQYQRGKEEAIEIFKQAVIEAITRWEENNYEE